MLLLEQNESIDKIILPNTFHFQPFYTNENHIVKFHTPKSFIEGLERCFYYDIQEVLGKALCKPWENNEEYVPILFEEWNVKKVKLNKLFKERNKKEARAPMIIQLALMIDAISWLNGEPVRNLTDWKNWMSNLLLKPINAVERIAFIMKVPDNYHSFIQLSELFSELEKIFHKEKMMKKKEAH